VTSGRHAHAALVDRLDPLHDPVVIVMKFGGTSLGGAPAIQQAVEIVRSHASRSPVVVVSALAGVTDTLLGMTSDPVGRIADLDALAARHREVLGGLRLDQGLLEPVLAELGQCLRAVRLAGEASPQATDQIASYGERLSARVFAAALSASGVEATAIDASEAGLRTDSTFGRARPVPDDGRIRTNLASKVGVPVVTGFFGADAAGNITTLGRDGSDFSAAWIGAALAVEEVQIWTDVAGVHTADPRIVPSARPIPRMSFADVADLGTFGGRVLHPAAMEPLRQAQIPLCVRSARAPHAAGTLVQEQEEGVCQAIRAIAHRDNVALITVRSQRLVPQHAFLSDVFRGLDAVGCEVGPVAIAEAAVTVAVEDVHAGEVVDALGRHGDVDAAAGRAVVGLIGDVSLGGLGGISGVLGALTRAGISATCSGLVNMGSGVALSVPSDQLVATVQFLHAECSFED